jgi:hypothetical protein
MKELPFHIVELIVTQHCDIPSKGKCRILNKYFNNLIGDITPIYIKNQNTFLNILHILCVIPKHSLFNFRLSSESYHLILSDENNMDIFLYVVEKGYGGKTFKRCYSKKHIVKNLMALFKRDSLFKGVEQPANVFFESIFKTIKTLSLSCAEPLPKPYLEWKRQIIINRSSSP